jgi:MFS family permease
MSAPDEARTAGELLHDRTVVLLLSSELLTSLAMGVMTVAIGWQGYARSHDPLVLGLIGLAEFVPAVLLALPSGHLADRHDRRLIAVIGLLVVAVVMAGLAYDASVGDAAVWPLYLLAMAAGAAFAFISPAFNPLLVASVPPASLSRVVAMSSVTWQSANIAGPAIGGLLQTLGDPQPYVAAVAFSLLAALAALGLPAALGTAHVEADQDRATLGDVFAGVRLILATPALLGAISLDLVAVLLGGATALLPIFSQDILHVGATANGFLRAAAGGGAVAVGIVLAARPIRRHVGYALFAAVAGYGAFTIMFGLSRSYVLSLVALAGLAGADMISVFVRSTVGPLLTPPALRGRVGAVERVFIGASNELGAFESGLAAALLGPVAAVVLGGIASIAVAGLWALWFPTLRDVDRFEDLEPASL